jgi:DNA-binding NtrC family response regulator
MPLAKQRPCAIVVDSDPGVRRTIEGCLEPEFEVRAAECAVRASALIGSLRRVDLAFLDLELSQSGREEPLLARLRHWPDAIRVLLVRGCPSGEAVLPHNRPLAHLLLAKPPSPSVVLALKRATLGLPKN